MNRPNPQRRELAKALDQPRCCGNCAHGYQVPDNESQLLCKGAPPSAQFLGAKPGVIGAPPKTITMTVWPFVRPGEFCDAHEFPEEFQARRSRLIVHGRRQVPCEAPAETEDSDPLQALVDDEMVS